MDFEREIAEHKDAVYRQMVRVCGNVDDAEDVLAEAMISAYKASDQLKENSSFRAWLVAIGRRACFKMREKGRDDLFTSLEALQEAGMPMPASDEITAYEELEKGDMTKCVMASIDTLEQIYQDVYMLREIDGKSAIETAEELNLSVSAVKSRLHRARTMVREALDKALCDA